MSSGIHPSGVVLRCVLVSPLVESQRVISAWSLFLLVGLILVLVVLLASFILVRSGRRRRAALDHKPAPPTASEDVWAMHKLSDDWDESYEASEDSEYDG